MEKQVNIILTGLNGYGENFVETLLKVDVDNHKLVAVVSRNPKKSQYYDAMLAKNVKIYDTIESCLAENKVDLAIISTPMHIHYREIVCALNHGANVFCEKPLAPTINECLEIKKISNKSNRFVAVGFQWSYSKVIQTLKQDILDNKFGKIKSIKTIIRWNRPKSYFENSNWKGKNFGNDGRYILECVMSNCAAHFLHNLLFLSGDKLNKAAYPISIEGEGYKAHKVDGYDTAFMRMKTDTGCELLYLATIVSPEEKKPAFVIDFEEATAYYIAEEASNIIVKTKDGRTLEYGSPEEGRFQHYLSAIESIRNGGKLVCDVDTVLPEVIAVNAAIENIPVKPFKIDMIAENGDRIWVNNINSVLERCFEDEKLPGELGFEWASKTEEIDIKGYRSFVGVALKVI